jgi:hypothetical protein
LLRRGSYCRGVSTGAVAPSLRAHREEFMPARQSRVLMYCHVLEFQIDSPLPDKLAHDLRQMTVRAGMTYLLALMPPGVAGVTWADEA